MFYFWLTTDNQLSRCTVKENKALYYPNTPSDAPRCAGFWSAAPLRPMNRWASVWRKSRLKLNENKKNDLLWLILHRAVRVRYSLKSWGSINNDKCAVCNRVENIEHCFLACPTVVRVWDYFSTPLSRVLVLLPPLWFSTFTFFFPLEFFDRYYPILDLVIPESRHLSELVVKFPKNNWFN